MSWEQQYLNEAGPAKITGYKRGLAMYGGLLAVNAIALSVSTYKLYLGKAAKACRSTKGYHAKEACFTKYKLAGMQKQISVLKSGMSKCNKDKNPEKCRSKIQAKIDKLKNTKIPMYQKHLRKYEMKAKERAAQRG